MLHKLAKHEKFVCLLNILNVMAQTEICFHLPLMSRSENRSILHYKFSKLFENIFLKFL